MYNLFFLLNSHILGPLLLLLSHIIDNARTCGRWPCYQSIPPYTDLENQHNIKKIIWI